MMPIDVSMASWFSLVAVSTFLSVPLPRPCMAGLWCLPLTDSRASSVLGLRATQSLYSDASIIVFTLSYVLPMPNLTKLFQLSLGAFHHDVLVKMSLGQWLSSQEWLKQSEEDCPGSGNYDIMMAPYLRLGDRMGLSLEHGQFSRVAYLLYSDLKTWDKREWYYWGTWVVQLFKLLSSAQVIISWFANSSPASGATSGGRFGPSIPLSLPFPPTPCLEIKKF